MAHVQGSLLGVRCGSSFSLLNCVVILTLGMMTACLDPEPEDPRQATQPMDVGVDAAQAGDASIPGDCPSAIVSEAEDAERCIRTFVYRPPLGQEPSRVEVTGDFLCPAWSATVPMAGPNDAGEWFLDLRIRPGRYTYKFIVDGNWIADPENPTQENDGVGGQNSVLEQACPNAPECVFAADCLDPAAPLCRFGQCVACDCPEGTACRLPSGTCEEQPCTDNAQCPEGVCSEGRCRACVADSECGEEYVCLNGGCIEPECITYADCDARTEECVEYQCTAHQCPGRVFVFDAAGANYDRVLLAGDFTNWLDGALALDQTPSGEWVIQAPLQNGDYLYKFVAYAPGSDDPIWLEDPRADARIPDGVGGFNSQRIVECSDASSGFGRCGDPELTDWREAVMYFVLVDRFQDSDGLVDPVPGATGGDVRFGPSGQYEGGDLAGTTARLDYLNDLGVTALWLSAPYENRNFAGAAIQPDVDPNQYSAYHGYWPSPENIDFSDPDAPSPIPMVEPRIGTSEDLHTLVDSAHEMGMKVLFDYVMNHVDVASGLYEAHPDWFARGDGRDGRPADGFALCGPLNLWDDPYWGERCAFTDYLPPFDFSRPDARAWSVADALWWAKEYNLDGYRLDAIKHVSMDWLTDLRSALNEAFPEPFGERFYLVGETFAYDDIGLLARYIEPETKLDGQFDFPLKARLCEGVFQGRMNDLQSWMDTAHIGAYGPGSLMTTWIGNHDIPRAIHFASGEIGNCREGSGPGTGWRNPPGQPQEASAYEKLGVAFGVLFTTPGIPLIYYGDEVGLAGGGDPDNRRMMPWEDDELLPAQRALRERIRGLSQVRSQYRALTRGRRTTLSSSGDQWDYRMSCGHSAHQDLTVSINRGDQGSTARGLPPGRYRDVETGETFDHTNVPLSPRSIRILEDIQD